MNVINAHIHEEQDKAIENQLQELLLTAWSSRHPRDDPDVYNAVMEAMEVLQDKKSTALEKKMSFKTCVMSYIKNHRRWMKIRNLRIIICSDPCFN